MPSNHLQPTVLVGEPGVAQNPYRHQGAYAIRRTPSNIAPPPPPPARKSSIPDDVKKSYERQQLPVRNQSLSAAVAITKAANAFFTHHVPQQQQHKHKNNHHIHSPAPSDSGHMSSVPSSPSTQQLQQLQHQHCHHSPLPTGGSASASITTDCDKANPTIHVHRSNSNTSESHNDESESDEDEDDALQHPTEETESPLGLNLVSPTMTFELDDHQSYFLSHCMANSPNDNTALLSHVANKLYSRILPEDVSRDGVEYHYLFTGKEAVDHLMDIIHLDDGVKHSRDQALIIGRSLESLDVFHAVDGSSRLQDGTRELYRFGMETIEKAKLHQEDGGDTSNLATGVFTPLTACYSPTCNGDNPCYSYSCPGFWRKKNQSARQSILPDKNKRALWIHSVPKEIIAATPPEERKRQECIYELIFTEEDFAKDLDYVHNHWVIPLMTTDVLSNHTEKRELVVKEIFWNMADIRRVSTGFSYALSKRRKEQDLVDTIGDIMVSFVRQFDPYISYGAHQVIGKHRFELEKRKNPKFAQFVKDTERKPESKRLELNGYLTKPTTRLGRYNLLLREILKRTPAGNSDLQVIPQVMEAISGLLEQVNSQTGKVSQCFTLKLIEERLISKPTSIVADLKLQEPSRELLMQGRLSRKESGSSDSSDLHVFLFDHYLLMTKPKLHNRVEHYKVFRKPIPLSTLSISVVDTPMPLSRSRSITSPSTSTSTPSVPTLSPRLSPSQRSPQLPRASQSSGTSASSELFSQKYSAGSVDQTLADHSAATADTTTTATTTTAAAATTTTITTTTATTTNTTATTITTAAAPISPSGAPIPISYGIIIYHHGKGGSPPVALFTSEATRELWVEKILMQKEATQSAYDVRVSNDTETSFE